jgi:hypothetical protein
MPTQALREGRSRVDLAKRRSQRRLCLATGSLMKLVVGLLPSIEAAWVTTWSAVNTPMCGHHRRTHIGVAIGNFGNTVTRDLTWQAKSSP